MLVAAVLILYAAGANIWLIAAGVALYGVANGMVTILRGIAVADYLGVAGFGRKSGMISAINGFALALAPYLAGLLWTGGGYGLVLAGLAAAAATGALAFWSLPAAGSAEIGRASCRGRVCTYGEFSVVAGTIKKKQINKK